MPSMWNTWDGPGILVHRVTSPFSCTWTFEAEVRLPGFYEFTGKVGLTAFGLVEIGAGL